MGTPEEMADLAASTWGGILTDRAGRDLGVQFELRDTPGGSHTVDWFFKGTHVPVCGPTTVSVAPCESAVFSCGSQPAPCELSHSGLLVVRNGTDWFTYDIVVDGSFIGRLDPQQQTDDWVSEDALHEVEFRGPLPGGGTACFRSATVAACEQLLVICP